MSSNHFVYSPRNKLRYLLIPALTLTLSSVVGAQAAEVDRWSAESELSHAFDIDVDPFAEGLLDLRELNEPVAGQNGFIRLSENGESYVRGDGQAGEQLFLAGRSHRVLQ